jgi:hypothetical protein
LESSEAIYEPHYPHAEELRLLAQGDNRHREPGTVLLSLEPADGLGKTMTPAIKPVIRESFASYRGKPIIVTIERSWIGLRLKGTRKTFQLDVEAAYQRACKIEALHMLIQKRSQKKGRRP